MALTDLMPRSRSQTPAWSGGERDPFFALHRDMTRLLDDFSRGFGFPAFGANWGGGWPHIEISETGTEVKIAAELPGLTEKDIELSLQDGVLTIRGEKSSRSEAALYSERWHGQFQRSLQVGANVDPEKVSASFRDGVLSVVLAKRPEAQSPTRRIAIARG
jgi:HSP20 family protein